MEPTEPRIVLMFAVPSDLIPTLMQHLATLPAEHLARIMVGHCGLEGKTEGASHE